MILTGDLDRRIEIQTLSTTANDYGEYTRSYSTYRTVWAAVEWKGGSEKMDESGKITGMSKLHFYIRNLDLPNLDLQSRIVFESKNYFPKVINQIEGRTAFLEIICEYKD